MLNRLRALRKEENGAVTVIVAVSLTVLFGFAALAMDFGLLAACRQSLQNAADAAALAAAVDLGDGKIRGTAESSAALYCRLNGADPADADVTMTVNFPAPRTVTVRVSRQLPMGFSAVLTGKKERSVSAEATAEAVSIFGDCPYAMFAGQKIEDDGTGITITGNDILINGNIHSNSDISMKKAVLGTGFTATAVRKVDPSTSGWSSDSMALDMPSFRSFEGALPDRVMEFTAAQVPDSFSELIAAAEYRYHQQHWDWNYLSTGLYLHVSGDLTFNGSGSTEYTARFPIVLIVDGDITLNGGTLNSTWDYPIAVMSKKNITVNGGGAVFIGILYAPDGDIVLDGNDAVFAGSIVGQNIRKTGGMITVSYLDGVDRFLPASKVHLIQ